jgi:effector-binding domain-containing protein
MGVLEKFKNTQSYLDNYSNKLTKLLKSEIQASRSRSYVSGSYSNPINTTGSLANSLSKLSNITSNRLSYQIKGNSYASKLDKGSPQGRFPNIQDLVKWIKDKRLTLADVKTGEIYSLSDTKNVNRIAYLIGRKIDNYGTKETKGFISDAIEKSMGELNALGSQVSKDVSLNVDDILIKSGYIKKGDTYEYKMES